MISNKLVSIGIPTYNRPEGLKKTLECVTGQTYKNLEIIVSDNCSTNTDVEKVVTKYIKKDKRIKFYRQAENKGAPFNFKYVLGKSTGKYFMWAADDDYLCNYYINDIISQFRSLEKSSTVAINMEAQYYDINGYLSFFAEGRLFYNYYDEDKYNRISHILENNYGNLIYSIYKSDVLKSIDVIFVENEIPFFIQIAEKGNWLVIPKIGYFKKTTIKSYNQAKWENEGGKLPDSSFSIKYYKSLWQIFIYHKVALDNILKSITLLAVDKIRKCKLSKIAKEIIWNHFICFVIQYKRKVPKY